METYLSKNNNSWEKVGEHVHAVDSTNAEWQRRLTTAARGGAPIPDGSWLSAAYQAAGRGRVGRVWEGAAGENLAVSFVVDGGELPADRLFALSQAVSLAVAATLDEALAVAIGDSPRYTPEIKWPNDVYVANRKLAGILIETTLRGERLAHAVVGVGANVNQVHFAPALTAAGSLRALDGRVRDLDALARALARSLEHEIARLRALTREGDYYELTARYHARLRGLGARQRYRRTRDGEAFQAELRGVDAAGRLRLRETEDAEHAYALDEVRYLGDVSFVG